MIRKGLAMAIRYNRLWKKLIDGSKLIYAIGEIFHIFYITVLWLVFLTVLKQDLEQFVLLMSIFMHGDV